MNFSQNIHGTFSPPPARLCASMDKDAPFQNDKADGEQPDTVTTDS